MGNGSLEEFKLLLAACFFGAVLLSVAFFVVGFGSSASYRASAIETATTSEQ
jgi:hypothetical protein